MNEPINCTASELSTFLQALGEGYFPTYYSDINPCVPSRSMTIASKSFPKGKRTVCFRGFQFSMTLQPSTGSLGADTLTLSAEGSPAKTSASPDVAMASMGNEAAYGPKWPGSLAKYDPDTRSWRTHQCSLLGGLEEYLATWPNSGTMQSGSFWERTMQVPRIAAKGSGYWPTPTASQARSEGMILQMRAKVEAGDLTREEAELMIQGSLEPARMQAWANTPSGNWPTPTCADAYTDKLKSAQQKEGSMHSVNLSQAVRMWPTPTVSPSRGLRSGDPNDQNRIRLEPVGGQLNPDWVEWLMGWCVHWSSLEPLSHDDFNEWLARAKGGATQVPPDRLRELRNNEQAASAPQGSEPEQQHTGEHCDTVPGLPCEGTREGGGLGARQCEAPTVRDMREDVPVRPNEAREVVQPEMLGEVGQVGGGEKVGEQEQGSDLRTLRDDVSIHPTQTDDMQRIVREQDGMGAPSWWATEPLNVPRVATGIAKRADRLKATGNGQVPAVVRLAWNTLYNRIANR